MAPDHLEKKHTRMDGKKQAFHLFAQGFSIVGDMPDYQALQRSGIKMV
jgi:hypothetical protein